jgi:hypothetical protein
MSKQTQTNKKQTKQTNKIKIPGSAIDFQF